MRSRWGLPGMVVIVAFVALTVGACHKKVPPVARPVQPPPPTTFASPTKPPAPPEPISEPVVVPPAPFAEDRVSTASLDEINKNSPLKPVFFNYDTAEISSEGQKILDGNAEVLKKNSPWIVTIEGHCDERGTAEYNLALGERRAVSARTYLVSLGILADRIRTVSYGKEFPFDPGHSEAAWGKNRRDHFVVTQK